MSFLHTIEVGYFQTEDLGALSVESSCQFLARYNQVAPPELRITPEQPVMDSPQRGVVVAVAEGYPIIHRKGKLICPYLLSQYFYGSIVFALCAAHFFKCDVYTPDEGRVLTADELLSKSPFSDIVRQMMTTGPME
jgi:hypothetical protein